MVSFVVLFEPLVSFTAALLAMIRLRSAASFAFFCFSVMGKIRLAAG